MLGYVLIKERLRERIGYIIVVWCGAVQRSFPAVEAGVKGDLGLYTCTASRSFLMYQFSVPTSRKDLRKDI